MKRGYGMRGLVARREGVWWRCVRGKWDGQEWGRPVPAVVKWPGSWFHWLKAPLPVFYQGGLLVPLALRRPKARHRRICRYEQTGKAHWKKVEDAYLGVSYR